LACSSSNRAAETPVVTRNIRTAVQDGVVHDTVGPHGSARSTLLYREPNGQQVKRPALGAEGFVLDHYDRSATDHYLKAVGDRLFEAFGSTPPHAIFCDSLEVYLSDWAPDLLEEFQRRRGYDLTPYLPRWCGHWRVNGTGPS
jgi:hypothetical protein